MVSLNTIGENSSGLKPTIIINEKYNNNTKVLNVTLIRFWYFTSLLKLFCESVSLILFRKANAKKLTLALLNYKFTVIAFNSV